MRITSYPKVWNLGHPKIVDLFRDPVVVEEKVDGSQFSFCLTDKGLEFKSRRALVYEDSPGMFSQGVEAIKEIAHLLTPGWVYRGEYLSKPKHNTLTYGRVPEKHVVLWDIEPRPNVFLGPREKRAEAYRLGLEVVPTIEVTNFDMDAFKGALENESFLGGPKIEGLVFKNYHRFGEDGKILAGKYVSESFKETHQKDWKKRHRSDKDIKLELGEYVRTEARWRKAVERLRDEGKLEYSPRDIGLLMKEIQQDVERECEEEIKEKLWTWARKDVIRNSSKGFAEWYKTLLAESQFGEE